jgi:hypothetical protein
MPSPDLYIPGTCNIGPAEIRLRRRSGWVGLAATLVLAALLFATHVSPAWRFLLFFPALTGATGFLQGALHFCLGFGFKAVFNFGEPGVVDSVTQAEFRALDRHKAQLILLYSALIALAVSILAYALG